MADRARPPRPAHFRTGKHRKRRLAARAGEYPELFKGQIWWPPPLGPDHGYRGAWGVTCADDSFDARNGMPFPDARAKPIASPVLLLEEE